MPAQGVTGAGIRTSLLQVVIALQFGHRDGGELVRKLYGHPEAAIARRRVREAFRQAPPAPVALVAAAR